MKPAQEDTSLQDIAKAIAWVLQGWPRLLYYCAVWAFGIALAVFTRSADVLDLTSAL